MKKRIFPALLALVLTLSIVPVAFASPMTLVLQTIGDTGKEFVYYIDAGEVDGNLAGENVEEIRITVRICNCGFTIFSIQENAQTIFINHALKCGKNGVNYTGTFYKITVKDGDSIRINTIGAYLPIFFEQPTDYSLSYSIDGGNFTYYKIDETIINSERGMARIIFTAKDNYFQNQTITLRRSDGSVPDDTPPASDSGAPDDTPPTSDTGTSFPDVSPDADYAAAVEYLNELGIMEGDEKGNFNPDKIVNRAEMAAIVCRMLGQADNLPKSNVFTDVPTTYWGNEYVGKASELGIVNGYGDGRFGPTNPVTYEQAITMIVRAIGEEELAVSYGGYPTGYWLVAYHKNLLKGVAYLPGQGLPRSSIAVLVYNYYTAQS